MGALLIAGINGEVRIVRHGSTFVLRHAARHTRARVGTNRTAENQSGRQNECKQFVQSAAHCPARTYPNCGPSSHASAHTVK